MGKSPHRDLHVFDFKEEDEIAESASDKNLAKFKTPVVDLQSLSNHHVLPHDTHVDKDGVKIAASIPCLDAVVGDFNLEKGDSHPTVEAVEDAHVSKEKSSELDAADRCTSHENHCHLNMDIDKYNKPEAKGSSGGISSPESQIDPPRATSSDESVDVNSEAGECINESSPSSPVSDIAENVSLNGNGWNDMDNSDMDDANTEVVLHPDYVIYQNSYYMGPKLTFSPGCIKISVSTPCIKEGASALEWGVDDLIDIESQLFQSSGTVIIKVHVISTYVRQSNHVSGTSGIEELEIAVVDSDWSMRHEQITSLNKKYSAIWNDVLCAHGEGNESDSHGPRCYFPNFVERFDEVVYPKGDPDAVSLSIRDVELLRPDTFINDTIIDFYIQYLKNKIQEKEKSRFHFFNSFFFRKLADMDKNPSSASDGKAAFLRVRKWTRKVNLFEKDYIFIPVNFNLHWSLIVICHAGEVVNFNDKELGKSLKVPCILHMDSIKGNHSGLKNLIQSYLWEEWKERHKDTLEEEFSSRFFNMRFLPLALPQQDNSYDCGLFLLHYLELFLAEAPSNFNPFKLTKFSNFLNVDWFPPGEAYLKRGLIQRLIFELVENQDSHESSSPDSSDDDHIYLGNNDNRSGIQCPELNRLSTAPDAGQGIEITLLSGSTSLDPPSFNNSDLVLKELLDPGAAAGTLVGQCQSFDQQASDYRFSSSIFPMEDTDLGEQFMYLTPDPNLQQVAGITPQTCSLSYIPRDCGDETCHKSDISLQAEHGSSMGGSDDSDDIGVIENCPVENEATSSIEADRLEKNCTSMENPEHIDDISVSDGRNLPIVSVLGIAQHSNSKCDDNNNGDAQETSTVPLRHVSDAVDDDDDKVTCDGQMSGDMTPDICEEQIAKRRRLMPLQSGSEGILTESNS